MATSVSVAAAPTATGWSCEVKLESGGQALSEHTVEVTRSDLTRYAPDSQVEDLVRRSFEFLLDREPPRSILRRFALSDIERYFPEYPRVIRP